MHQRLAELDRLDEGCAPSAPRRRVHGQFRRRPVRALRSNPAVVVVLVALVAVGGLAWGGPNLPLSVRRVIQKAGGAPPVPWDASRQPLGSPPPAPAGEGGYRFIAHQPGTPEVSVTYDPCRPIHVVVNDSIAPSAADRLLRDTIREVSRATGLVFTVDGSTDEVPREIRPAHDERYGDQWSPVLVAWTTPAQVPDLAGPVAGVGGSIRMRGRTGTLRYVTGFVSLDTPALRRILARPDGYQQARAIVMHEFGHLVGLDHVADPEQLMYETNNGQFSFNDGDLRGLRQLGLGECHFDT